MSTRALRLLAAAALLVAVVVATAPPAAAARAGRLLSAGGWSPIKDVSDPYIQELGGWAVAEYVKQQAGNVEGLLYGKVIGGEQQVVSGMNYKLILDATDANGMVAAYRAFVFDQAWTNTRELKSFEQAN